MSFKDEAAMHAGRHDSIYGAENPGAIAGQQNLAENKMRPGSWQQVPPNHYTEGNKRMKASLDARPTAAELHAANPRHIQGAVGSHAQRGEDAPKETTVDAILTERGKRYGLFTGHAAITQDLKQILAAHLGLREKRLAPDQQEALDMICHKIGRIINGDANYDDSWVDIAGYAQLVADRLQGKVR